MSDETGNESRGVSAWRRWALALVATVALFVVAGFSGAINAGVVALLRSPAHALIGWRVLAITMPDVEKGGTRTIPVDYLRDGERILCGSDFSWWRNLIHGPEVELVLDGQSVRARARVVSDETERRAGFVRIRASSAERRLRNGAVLIELTPLGGSPF